MAFWALLISFLAALAAGLSWFEANRALRHSRRRDVSQIIDKLTDRLDACDVAFRRCVAAHERDGDLEAFAEVAIAIALTRNFLAERFGYDKPAINQCWRDYRSYLSEDMAQVGTAAWLQTHESKSASLRGDLVEKVREHLRTKAGLNEVLGTP